MYIYNSALKYNNHVSCAHASSYNVKHLPKVFNIFKYFLKIFVDISINISVSRSHISPAKLITFNTNHLLVLITDNIVPIH